MSIVRNGNVGIQNTNPLAMWHLGNCTVTKSAPVIVLSKNYDSGYNKFQKSWVFGGFFLGFSRTSYKSYKLLFLPAVTAQYPFCVLKISQSFHRLQAARPRAHAPYQHVTYRPRAANLKQRPPSPSLSFFNFCASIVLISSVAMSSDNAELSLSSSQAKPCCGRLAALLAMVGSSESFCANFGHSTCFRFRGKIKRRVE